MQISVATMDNSRKFLQKLKTRQNYHMIQQFHFWLYIQRKLKSQSSICTSIFIAAIVCVCVCVRIYTHTMDYYSAMTKRELLPFTTTWMDLESNVLSEISQTEKSKINGIDCIWNLRKKKKAKN